MVNREDEMLLDSIMEDKADIIKIGRKAVKMKWLKRGTLRKMSSIMLDSRTGDKVESKVSCKIAATVRLNGFFKIKFFYSLLWRWYYYIKQYDDSVLLPLIDEAKKKVQLREYYSIMILAQGLRDTQQTMTREEVSRTLQELQSAHRG